MAEGGGARRGALGQATWLWALAALIVVGGFLVWLGLASEPTTVQVVEEEREERELGGATATTVEPEDLANAPAEYVGREIRLTRVPVASMVGEEAFWVSLPFQRGEIPYLVKADSALAAELDVERGRAYTIVGTVREMTDSIVDAWVASGAIEGEGQRAEVGFAGNFLHATAVRAARGQAPAARQQPEQGAGEDQQQATDTAAAG